MNVLIFATIRVVRAGLYEGSFQIMNEDGYILGEFRKEYPKQGMSAVSYNMAGDIWGRFKQNDHWIPVHLDADFGMNIPNWARRKAAAAAKAAEQQGQLADLGRMETTEIAENLFEENE